MTNTYPSVEEKLTFSLKKNTSIRRIAYTIGETIHLNEYRQDVNEMYWTDGVLNSEKIEKLFNMKRSSSHNMNCKGF